MSKPRERGGRAFAAKSHDHSRCVGRAVDKAVALCGTRGSRLTDLRRRVLELVWRSHEPIGAYDILGRLQRERNGAAPPTVYRALDFLIEHGLVHRIASLNAFVGCHRPDLRHRSQFLICRQCSEVAEIDDTRIDRAISASAAAAGFVVDDETIELHGLCPRCAKPGSGEVVHAR